MAEDLTTADIEAPAGPELPSEEPAVGGLHLDEPDHRSKFRLVYLALAGILGAAIAGFVFVLGLPDDPPRVAWAFEPTLESAGERAQEIASYIAPRYRLETGSQIVTIEAAPARVQDIPVATVAIKSTPDGIAYTAESIPLFDADETTVYIFCGLGPECAIEEGVPSEERQRLLRREALELALYTLRYVEDKDNVVVFLPPQAGFRAAYAQFFQRGDYEGLLDEPLETMLVPQPPLPLEIDATESLIIDRLTLPSFFGYQFTQRPDGLAVLVLIDPADVVQQPTAPPADDAPAAPETGTAAP
jgi:hypothetical protein